MISRNAIGDAFPIRRLGEAVEFLDSKRRPVTESDRRAGPYPYYGANGQQGTIDDYIFDEPLVLLAEDGGHFGEPDRGIAYRVSGKTWVNNHAHVLRPNPDVDHAFLCRVLEHYDVTPFVTGTTRGKLTKAGASEIVIPLPPMPEQRRIAEVLDRAEALRAKRRAALAQLDTLTQAIFLKLFGDPSTNPKGWTVNALADLCSIAGEYGAGLASKVFDPDLPRYVRITDVTDSGELDSQPVSPSGRRNEWDGFRLEPGDVLFARSGATVGKTYLHRASHGECVFAGYLIRFRPNPELITPEFLFHFTRTSAYRSWVSTRQRVVAQPNINARQYGRDLPVPVPPLNLQHEFASRVAAVEKLKTSHRTSLAELDALVASLQHRAFRGEL